MGIATIIDVLSADIGYASAAAGSDS